jgi:hypothetical protein
MEQNLLLIVATSTIAVTLAVLSLKRDRRAHRRARINTYSYRNDLWQRLLEDISSSNGWFRRELRMSKETFFLVANKLKGRWEALHPPAAFMGHVVNCYRNSKFN